MDILRNVLRACLLAVGLAAVLAACDKNPSGPSTPPPVTFARLEIAGPSSVPLGQTAQFTATAIYSDFKREDVTSRASWQTGQATVLAITPSGLATGRDRGETSVTVSFGGRISSKVSIFVLPSGTYRLSGIVRDAGVEVTEATVTVMSGAGQGLSTKTAGTYKLYGVAGNTEIRVTKDGYNDAIQTIDVTSHRTLDFNLTLTNPRDVVAGTHTLTVTAAPECASKLPPETLTRSYQAVITQNGPTVAVVLEGAAFHRAGSSIHNGFSGTVEPGRVTFRIAEGTTASSFYYRYYYYYPAVIEALPPVFLSFGGSAVTTPSGRRWLGTLNGSFRMYDALLRPGAVCSSASHRFELTQ